MKKDILKKAMILAFFSLMCYNLGITICEDAWNDDNSLYEINPIEKLIKNGANLLINISASPYEALKFDKRLSRLSSISKKYKVPFFHSNQVGGNDSLLFDGISFVLNEKGKVVSRASDFNEDLIFYDLKNQKGLLHSISLTKEESLLKSLVMATKDYVYKSGFKKCVIALSGGIDSALVLYIAVLALGKENVLSVFMPSKFTSYDNFEDTKKLAENLSVERIIISIDELCNEFNKISPFNEKDPLALQNIQARIRGNIIMAYANTRKCLVLSTGNKSEIAVGYCTLYGDMAGAFAVISDIYKTQVYELVQFINKEKVIIPERIIRKPPSAELNFNQKDQDDLPAYEILDKILFYYIEEKKNEEEIVNIGFDKDIVKKVIKMLKNSEHKRIQMPLGPKVSSKAFGYGRRYPVAINSFSRLS